MDTENNLVRIFFLYPQNIPNTTEGFVDEVLEFIKPVEGYDYAGFENTDSLRSFFMRSVDDEFQKKYKPLEKDLRLEIEKTIYNTVEKCGEFINLPNTPLVIYVSPWFPSDEDNRQFKGTYGFSPYKTVIHLSLSVHQEVNFSSLTETITHEINHTIFYDRYKTFVTTIHDYLLMEGLAENFREDVVGGDPAPWSTALNKNEASDVLGELETKELLHTEDRKIHNDLFYGSDKYKRWSGYSIGYWIVKNFKTQKPSLTWDEIMNYPPKKIFEVRIEK